MPTVDESCTYPSDKQSTESGKISSFVVFFSVYGLVITKYDSVYDRKLCHRHLCPGLKQADWFGQKYGSINVLFTFFCYLIDISFLNENEEWEHRHPGSLFLHVKSSGNNHFVFGSIFNLPACEDWIDDTVSVTIFVLPQALQSSGKIRYVSYNVNDDLNSK